MLPEMVTGIAEYLDECSCRQLSQASSALRSVAVANDLLSRTAYYNEKNKDLLDRKVPIEDIQQFEVISKLVVQIRPGVDDWQRLAISFPNITELSVKRLGLDAGHAQAIADAGFSNLTTLDLSLNGIGAAGAASIAEMEGLTTLNLSGNDIGDDTKHKLRNMARENNIIIRL
jgi:Leucine-rich repeat (LRR) protein